MPIPRIGNPMFWRVPGPLAPVVAIVRNVCLCCGRKAHQTEIIYHGTLGWACLRCVEDYRVQSHG